VVKIPGLPDFSRSITGSSDDSAGVLRSAAAAVRHERPCATHWCVHRYRHRYIRTQVHRYRHRYTGTGTQVHHGHTGTPVHRYTGTGTGRSTGRQVHRYTATGTDLPAPLHPPLRLWFLSHATYSPSGVPLPIPIAPLLWPLVMRLVLLSGGPRSTPTAPKLWPLGVGLVQGTPSMGTRWRARAGSCRRTRRHAYDTEEYYRGYRPTRRRACSPRSPRASTPPAPTPPTSGRYTTDTTGTELHLAYSPGGVRWLAPWEVIGSTYIR